MTNQTVAVGFLDKSLICVFQKYNADYDLSAKEGADSLAFISLMEEKLIPALVRDNLLIKLFLS